MKIIIPIRTISKKNNKRIFVKSGRVNVIPSKSFEIFREEAMWHLKPFGHFNGKVRVDFIFEMKGKLDSDLDNLQTSWLDILQDAEIIDDDKNVMYMTALKTGGHDNFRTIIEINQIKS